MTFGAALQDGAQGEYLFDENGYYTTGSEEIDVLLDEAIAACTTPRPSRCCALACAKL